MKEQETFVLIPESLMFDSEISSTAKILYGIIYSLASKNGYCWATNKYLSKILKTSISTVSRSLKLLKDNGYISISIERDKITNEVTSRKIITNISIKVNKERLKDELIADEEIFL